ncbi:MAG: DUF1415 domain-containing protein [Gammaproteobacteria bacterium]|nr:DUF1415 domain-containing protein [Gammaproteobacteria bacterium]
MTDVEQLTRRWLQECVLALELCPFAAPVLKDDSLRIAVSVAATPELQLQDFLIELDLLQGCDEGKISTTLLVYAEGLQDFAEFLELLELAQALLEQAGLAGVVQLASFHPQYRFEGEPAAALSHFTNRSPRPMLHLLRESMLTRVLAQYPDPAAIPRRNIARLEAMGREAVASLWGDQTLAKRSALPNQRRIN